MKLRKQTVALTKCAVSQNKWHAINRLSLTGIMLICTDPRHKAHHRSMSHRAGVAKLMKWRPVAQRLGATSNCHKLLVVVAVVCALSGAFWALFTSVPALRGNMFQRWFARVGPKALVFDAIYLGAVYLVFQKLLCKFKYHRLL